MSGVSAWANDATRKMRDDPFIVHESAPLDRLLGSSYDPSTRLEQANFCFRELMHATAGIEFAAVIRVVVPLTVSPALDCRPPTDQGIAAELSPFEPPALYISRGGAGGLLGDFEEYRVPVVLRAFSMDVAPDALVLYSCYRDTEAVLHGWDYYRAVWVNFDIQRP